MSVYFESRNNNDIMQIKDDAQLMWLTGKHKLGEHKISALDTKWALTLDGDNNARSYTPYVYSIAPENNKIFCVGNPTASPVFLFHRLSGTMKWNNYHVYFEEVEPKHLYVVCNSTETQADDLDVYVFENTRPTAGDYGLQCYDSLGRLSYDATSKPLRILDGFFQTNVSSDGNTFYGFTEKNYNYEGKEIAVAPFVAYCYNSNTMCVELTNRKADFKKVTISPSYADPQAEKILACIGIASGFGFGGPYALLQTSDYKDYWTNSMYSSTFVIDVTNF